MNPGNRRTALITGASAGIGAALARVYASEGWDLILTARREAPLQALAEELRRMGSAVTVLTADLADPAAPRALYEAVLERGLMVDALINNAGFSRTEGFLQTDPADHAAMIRVMLSAPVELARLFAPDMVARSYGRIVNVASLAGQMPATGGDTLYGPIKSFLIKASQGLWLETAGDRRSCHGALPRLHIDRVPRCERVSRCRCRLGLSRLDVADGRTRRPRRL